MLPPPASCGQIGRSANPLGLWISPLTDFTPDRSSLACIVSVVTLPPSTTGGSKRSTPRIGGGRSEPDWSSTAVLGSWVGLSRGDAASAFGGGALSRGDPAPASGGVDASPNDATSSVFAAEDGAAGNPAPEAGMRGTGSRDPGGYAAIAWAGVEPLVR